MIGKPLGHTQIEATLRHAHLPRVSVCASALRVSGSIAADLRPGHAGAPAPA